jgi:biotin transport system substrate-specific component
MKNLYKKKYLQTDSNDASYKMIRNIALVFLGTVALFAGSQLSIPIKPVPITFQTIVISLIGLTYSPRLAFITVLAYIYAGVLGLPMFIKFSSGLHHITGVTGGYLLGFLIAAPIMGIIKNKVSSQVSGIMICCLIGHFIIYLLGIFWLSTFIGLKQALYSGFIIYIPTGLLKIVIFSYLFSYISNKVKQ